MERLGGERFAVKVAAKKALRKKASERRRVAGERDALVAVRGHPNVVDLRCAWQTPGALCLCLSFCGGDDLERHARSRRPSARGGGRAARETSTRTKRACSARVEARATRDMP